MFKQIFRLTFVTFVWKQYKRVIVSTLVLFAFLWLVGNIHEDYLSYAEQLDDKALASQSFIYKWLALCSGVMVYLAYHFIRTRTSTKTKGHTSPNTKPQKKPYSVDDDNDPFAEIRTKEKLRTRAEIMIDQEKSK